MFCHRCVLSNLTLCSVFWFVIQISCNIFALSFLPSLLERDTLNHRPLMEKPIGCVSYNSICFSIYMLSVDVYLNYLSLVTIVFPIWKNEH